MAKSKAHTTATIATVRPFQKVAIMVAALPLLPAIIVNIETQGNSSYGWTAAAAASVILSAIFFKAVFADVNLFARVMFLGAGLLCFTGNVQNAMINAATVSDRRSDHLRGMVADSERQRSQLEQWSHGRNTQAIVAGEHSPQSFTSQINQMIAADARRWRLTEECNPIKITLGASQEFCASIEAVRVKLEAARKRDEFDAKIAAHKSPEQVTSDDPYADSVVDAFKVFGYDVKPYRELIGRSPVMVKTVVLEVMATFGPTAVLAVFAWMCGWNATPPRDAVLSRDVPSAPAAPAPAEPRQPATPPLAVPSGDDTHLFIAECLEDAPGSILPAATLWALYVDWCRKRGAEPGTQKALGGKLKQSIAWENNNNRPRYLNVRIKAIRLVKSG